MASERSWLRRAEAVAGKMASALKRIQGADTVYDQVMAVRDADAKIGNASVAADTTATLVSYTIPASPALWRYWGFRVWTSGIGEPTDAKAWVEVGGIEIEADELHAGRRVAGVVLPLPIAIDNTLVITLRVRNRGGTTTTFIGKLLGE